MQSVQSTQERLLIIKVWEQSKYFPQGPLQTRTICRY